MDVHHFFESINRRILKRKLKEVIRDKRFYRLLCILIEHDKIALVAKILTDAGVEIDAEQTKTLVGCIAFDDISGALEILQEIGITGAMFDELKEIIEEMRKGVPLGYFTSQWFGNFYLKALDHYIKEELHAEHYMRYMDDMVILGKSKKKLHKIHAAIETYLNDNLDLEIKGDWQVFRFEYPVFDKGGNPVLDKDGKQVTKGRMLDFMGFQFHHDRTTIRKSNIEAARRKANHISKQDKISWYNASVMLSYMGLFKHTDTYNYYIDYIKPKINVKKLKRIVSKHSRKENEHDRLEKGDRNTAGQAGGEGGAAAAGATANNTQPNNQNGGQTGQGRGNGSAGSNENGNRSGAAAGMSSGAAANANSGVENPGSGNGQNAGSGQNAGTGGEGQPANDGGASAAGPRENNAQEQANQIVNSSKEKIAAAAQNTAAEKGGSSGKPGKVESPNKNGKKDDKKDNAAEKKAQAQIEELQRAISGLELEKKELEKQLRNLGGKPAAGNATGSNDELQKKMKKLEEDKQKAESLLEALKNQK